MAWREYTASISGVITNEYQNLNSHLSTWTYILFNISEPKYLMLS
jgi:hypothetical protein